MGIYIYLIFSFTFTPELERIVQTFEKLGSNTEEFYLFQCQFFLVYWSRYSQKNFWYSCISINIVRTVIFNIMKTPQSEYVCQIYHLEFQYSKESKMLLQLFKLLNYWNSLMYLNTTKIVFWEPVITQCLVHSVLTI